jgi:hypothetical protein
MLSIGNGRLDPLELFAFLGILSLIVVGSVQTARANRRKREMEHLERMKSLEMGLTPGPSGFDWPAAAVCIAIGAGVPIGSFVVAWLASLTADVPSEIWVAPILVSFGAFGTTMILSLRIIEPKGKTRPLGREQTASNFEKPEFDPDAFDVVGSRG